jgi:molecular chaperone Hsp33
MSPSADDVVAPFQIETRPVRGRIARLGPAIDEILTRHAYPETVANLLGETCALAALVGASLKFDGRLIVQAQGDGPVAYAVADYDTSGALRAYCRFDAERVAAAGSGVGRPGAGTLLGRGVFVMTIDQGPDMDRYQGVTAIEGDTLALAAETYFTRSEQTPTRVRLAVARVDEGDGPHWRAGGLLIQNIAADEARGPTAEAWTTAQALFETVSEDELVDPTISARDLLWRLFHQEGVRLFNTTALTAACRCSETRIVEVLNAFPPAERAAMIEPDGHIRVVCEYCARVYDVAPERVG